MDNGRALGARASLSSRVGRGSEFTVAEKRASSIKTTMTASDPSFSTTTFAPPDDTRAKSLPHSPHAMAQAVLDEAIAERDRQSQRSEGDTTGAVQDAAATSNKRPRTESDHNDKNVMDQLKKLWEGSEQWKEGEDAANEALDATAALVYTQIESLVRSGLEAYHGWESTRRDLSQVEEECEAKERELRRLRVSEEQSRATITNLLRTVETDKSVARDASRVVQVEARLRADLSMLRAERNDALAEAAESKRKAELLEEEVRTTKTKLSRLVQEKIKMERDSRAAISLARSLDSHASSDCDFYRRKVAELTNSLQTKNALVAEQKHQIEEMRRQMERSMSQNRLANIRAESGKAHKRNT